MVVLSVAQVAPETVSRCALATKGNYRFHKCSYQCTKEMTFWQFHIYNDKWRPLNWQETIYMYVCMLEGACYLCRSEPGSRTFSSTNSHH